MGSGESWTIERLEALSRSGEEIFAGNRERARQQLRTEPARKRFVFPDGEAVTIEFVTNNGPSIEYLYASGNGNGAGRIPALNEAAAEGDPLAAIELHNALRACESAHVSRSELDEAIRNVRQGRTPLPPGVTSIEQQIESAEETFERCRRVTPELKDRASEYLRAAAQSGHERSALIVARSVRDTNPELAETYYRRAWQNGSIQGLKGLSAIYTTAESLSYEEAVTSYAYFYAAHAIELAFYDGLTYGVHSRYRRRLVDEMRSKELSVSAGILDDAISLAKDVIKSNENCCR